ncbi:MAG: glycoside hydrolase family 3 C-terminal domain-containing protein [Lachnospiraceae bacterium]|nr:glycoside hydrolase family 3 C-terminal domain-containing protein [Lachnospiraceae bacterium]
MVMHPYEKEHLERIREGIAGCTVLLKSNGDFPLEGTGDIALFGSGVRRTVKGGTGSGEVNSRFFVNVYDGIKNAGFHITTDSWLDEYEKEYKKAREKFIADIKERARKKHTLAVMEALSVMMPEPEYNIPLEGEGDVAVYVLARISGEGSDRELVGGDILLSGPEIRDIITLHKKYKKFMLVINAGGPVDLSPVVDAVDNILILSQLGAETGDVLADILLGKSYPSGKLTTTWAAFYDYPRVGDFAQRDDTHYREGVYVGYRYFDSTDTKPHFPFGYGLTYTTFKLSGPEAEAKGEKVTVSVDVKNTGKRPGREVVQLYVSKPDKLVDTPYQELVAFVKTPELAPGETQRVSCSFNMSDITVYDASQAAYILEEGDYFLRLGTSSADTDMCAVVRLAETAIVKKVRNYAGIDNPDYRDWQPETRRSKHRGKISSKLPILEIQSGDIPQTVVDYDKKYEIDERIKKYGDDELSYMMLGTFDPNAGIGNLIGADLYSVAGAVGETAEVFNILGIKRLIMADGPAGLRLARDYFRDEKGGVHAMGDTVPETMQELLPPPARGVMKIMEKKPRSKADIHHQYCTAIPIATAIAQSFDVEFARTCGDIVGNEMERFGIQLWLAPALNIHRDIRCGRNFEYFSEDPFLSGAFARAITEGVQAHPGCGVTIKHFACNNQETNRSNNNSVVSERALREIYIRGFEYCIKYADPASLMTSYNLVNGAHTASKSDLLRYVLRCDLGYDGVVMTDWWVEVLGNTDKDSIHERMEAFEVTAVGGDLFMPGSRKDHRNILDAMRDGRLSRQQMEINASRVARLADRLTVEK